LATPTFSLLPLHILKYSYFILVILSLFPWRLYTPQIQVKVFRFVKTTGLHNFQNCFQKQINMTTFHCSSSSQISTAPSILFFVFNFLLLNGLYSSADTQPSILSTHRLVTVSLACRRGESSSICRKSPPLCLCSWVDYIA
jgi:hypothetical protein